MKIINIVKLMLKEAEDPEDVPSNVKVMMDRFKILKPVIDDLLGTDDTDIENIVSNIEVVVFKPTTFKVVFKNGNEMLLKYSPAPTGINGISKSNFKPKDFFQCQISGKKFNLINRSQFQQALDYIGQLLKNAPITKKNDDMGGETPEEQGNGQPNQQQQQQGNEEEPQ
jgi:hypothetical protein